MIKLVDITFPFPENAFEKGAENPFLCRILSLYHAYGAYVSFADFWIGISDNGIPVSAVSRLDSQFTLYLTENSDLTETAEFIYAVGAESVLCDTQLLPKLHFPKSEIGDILKFSEDICAVKTDIKIEVPPLKAVLELLRKTNQISPSQSDMQNVYMDLAHKTLNKCARIYAVVNNGKYVSCAMTVAEAPRCAVIGAVATDPDFRNRGYAGTLVRRLCEELNAENKAVYVYTQDKNRRFYENLGFSSYGKWSEYGLN